MSVLVSDVIEVGDRIKSDHCKGIALRVDEIDESGFLICHMIGDDKMHKIDPCDATIISTHEYCGSCGQLGCTANE